MTDKMREEFEKWYGKKYKGDEFSEMRAFSYYVWQAAWKIAQSMMVDDDVHEEKGSLPDEIYVIAAPWFRWDRNKEFAKYSSEIHCCDAPFDKYIRASIQPPQPSVSREVVEFLKNVECSLSCSRYEYDEGGGYFDGGFEKCDCQTREALALLTTHSGKETK